MRQSRILYDFSPLKAGGGIQLATNFIDQLIQKFPEEPVNLLLPDVGPLLDLSKVLPGAWRISMYPSSSFMRRAVYELTTLPQVIQEYNINLVFTFFGSGLRVPSYVKSIVSTAYPIICYPESAYWRFIPLPSYLRSRAINTLRRSRLRKATLILSETLVMQSRLSKALSRSNDCIKVVSPAPSAYVSLLDKYISPAGSVVRLLFLSGLAPHKNAWRLVELADALEALEFDFIVSIASTREAFAALAHSLPPTKAILDRRFNFLGSVPARLIDGVYHQHDILLALSDLESFSNNIMESWKSRTPLIISDRDFNRSICGASALYIEPHNPVEAASLIKAASKDVRLLRQITEIGAEKLLTLPSQPERFQQIQKILTETLAES